MTTYQIKSVKIKQGFEGTLDEAIDRAIEINDEYQPSFGVQVEDESGETLWDSEMTDDELISEIAEAVEAADVCAPEQVADMCMIAAKEGRDWRAELARAKANDADERKTMGIDQYRFEHGSLHKASLERR